MIVDCGAWEVEMVKTERDDKGVLQTASSLWFRDKKTKDAIPILTKEIQWNEDADTLSILFFNRTYDMIFNSHSNVNFSNVFEFIARGHNIYQIIQQWEKTATT